VQRFYVGPDLRNAYADDDITPLAPFPDLINIWLTEVAWRVVKHHRDMLRDNLPGDVFQWLSLSTLRTEQANIGRPFQNYVPPHQWVDGNNRRLSDRIWEVSVRTRTKIDRFLDAAIRQQQGAFQMADTFERFLLPGRRPIRTRKPYGTDASFDTMRLMRTEIARHHADTTKRAAIANPFADGMEFKLSPSHPRIDICDDLATLGMRGERLREPYPVGSAPLPVFDTHPQCICSAFAVSRRTTQEVVDSLRERIRRGEPPPQTPANGMGFLKRLMGSQLVNLVLGFALTRDD